MDKQRSGRDAMNKVVDVIEDKVKHILIEEWLKAGKQQQNKTYPHTADTVYPHKLYITFMEYGLDRIYDVYDKQHKQFVGPTKPEKRLWSKFAQKSLLKDKICRMVFLRISSWLLERKNFNDCLKYSRPQGNNNGNNNNNQ